MSADAFDRKVLRVALAWGLLLTAAALGCRRGHNGRLKASGVLEATEVDVASKIPGRLETVRVQEGDVVRLGEVLAELDRTELDLQLAQARAAAESATSQVALAAANLDLAEKTADRLHRLRKASAVSPHDTDTADTRLAQARAQLDAARAQQRQAEAAVRLMSEEVEDAVLVSPIAGVVLHRSHEPGEVVAPGAPVVTVADLNHLWVRVYVPLPDLGRVFPGQPAEVEVDAFPGKAFPARVESISSEAEFTPKNIQTPEERVKEVFSVKLGLDNPDLLLKPGMPADAVLLPRPVTAQP